VPVRGGWRYAAVGLVVLLVLAGAGVVVHRVFAPAELQMVARGRYPPASRPVAGVSGELARTPLIVDRRLRVYAAKRQVWADTPIRGRTESTPYWSLRRWPEEVRGVVVSGSTVVSQWSDGELAAVDARTGRTAWRVRVAVDPGGYAGRRTGAATVYEPTALYGARDVVVSTGGGSVHAYEAATGAPLWTVPDSCGGVRFAGPAFFGCAAPPVLKRYDLRTGRQLADWRPPGASDGGWTLEPLACAVGRSECAAARTRGENGVSEGWLFEGPEIVTAPGLAAAETWLAGSVAVGPSAPGAAGGVEFTARDASTDAPLWTWRPGRVRDASPARIVATEPGAIYLLTVRRTLVVLNPKNGLERTRFTLVRLGQPRWVPGHVLVRDRFVVVERLTPGADPAASDNAYYAGLRPVLVAGS
jgi:hypothetical protein